VNVFLECNVLGSVLIAELFLTSLLYPPSPLSLPKKINSTKNGVVEKFVVVVVVVVVVWCHSRYDKEFLTQTIAFSCRLESNSSRGNQ
jgi:hypothetical protein